MTGFETISCSLLKYSLLILLLAGLGGCSNPVEPLLDDYRTGLEQITGRQADNNTRVQPLTWPDRRDRQLPIDEIRVGLLRFFNLYDCELFAPVNDRNSVMGKLMPASRRLVYELEFLRAARRCADKLVAAGEDQQFVVEFDGIVTRKHDDLYRVLWNATLASEEMQKAFSLAVEPLLPEAVDQGYGATLQALQYFERISRQPEQIEVDISQLEQHNYQLQDHRFGGRVLVSVATMIEALEATEPLLIAAIDADPDCGGAALRQFSTDRLRPLQSYADRLYRQGGELLRTINRLIDAISVTIPARFADYRAKRLALTGPDSLWQRFEQLYRRHHLHWQTLTARCR